MAFKTGITLVSNVPVGPKILITFDFTGPASYLRTAGMVVTAQQLGVGGFEFIDSSMDSTGTFQLEPQINNGGYGNAVPTMIMRPIAVSTATAGGQSQTAGTEAAVGTNLSTFSFRIQAFCV